LEKKYPNQLVVLGVHTPKFENEKDAKSIRKAMDRYEMHHPVLNDADRKVWTRYGVQSWPTLFVVDPEGNLVGKMTDEKVFDGLDRAVSQLIRIHRGKKTLNEKPLPFQQARAAEAGDGPLFFPGKVLADEERSRLFIADSTHHRIVVTDLSGEKMAIIGKGVPGKDDGSYEEATFADPQGLALKGNTLYVADRKNHSIRAVDLKDKTVKTIAGTGYQNNKTRPRGPARKISLNSPWGLWVHENTLFIAMAGHHQIWTLDLSKNIIGPWAGNANEAIVDGNNASASFAQPSGLASDGANLYVADSEDSGIRAVSLGGRGVRTLVGTGLFDYGDRDGVWPNSRLQHALDCVFVDGKLYVTDTYNSKIKVVDPATRNCTTFIGADGGKLAFNEPGGISYAGGKLYVADTNAHRIRVVDVKTKDVTTLDLKGVGPPKAEKAEKSDKEKK
jgi:DNA-binding beta-propeller fold protein YncE